MWKQVGRHRDCLRIKCYERGVGEITACRRSIQIRPSDYCTTHGIFLGACKDAANKEVFYDPPKHPVRKASRSHLLR